MLKKIIASIAVASMSTASVAAEVRITPVQSEGQTVRYDRGIATIEDDMARSAVKIVPIPELDHGSIQFDVAVFNKPGSAAANFGVENIRVTRADGSSVPVLTRQELERRARNRARWSQIGMALLAGAAAAAQNNNTYINTYTPRGTITTVINRPGLSTGQVATIAAGGAGIALSQHRLEQTIAQLRDEIVQTTTIDPDGTYGGRVILDKIKQKARNERLTIDIEVGGEHHIFKMNVAR